MGTTLSTPIRTCIGCRTARPKSELFRLVRTPDGVRFDPAARLEGRGAYVCPNQSCVATLRRRDATAVRRALRGAPATEIDTVLDALSRAVQQQVPSVP